MHKKIRKLNKKIVFLSSLKKKKRKKVENLNYFQKKITFGRYFSLDKSGLELLLIIQWHIGLISYLKKIFKALTFY